MHKFLHRIGPCHHGLNEFLHWLIIDSGSKGIFEKIPTYIPDTKNVARQREELSVG